MSVSAGVFAPELAQLGVTLGVLLPRADGGFDFNDAFFADPIGALRGVVSDPVRLDALLSLLDFGDGPPTVGERTRIRLQRFGAASIYLTIDRTAGGVDLGVAGTAAYQKGGVGLAGEGVVATAADRRGHAASTVARRSGWPVGRAVHRVVAGRRIRLDRLCRGRVPLPHRWR